MKTTKLIYQFLIFFAICLVMILIFKFVIQSSDQNFVEELLISIGQSLTAAVAVVFSLAFEKIKKTLTNEEFKTARKSLTIYMFLFTWLPRLALDIAQRVILNEEIHWVKMSLLSLLVAVLVTALISLLSGVYTGKRSGKTLESL